MDHPPEAARYYDTRADTNIEGFVRGNARIEAAWRTIVQRAPEDPRRILDLGCGIGEICWRAGRKWPDAEIIGVDLSPRSISVARRLFGSQRISFKVIQQLGEIHLPPQDLILLIDVFEHIPEEDVPSLVQVLEQLIAERTRLIITFPTAEYQAWLRRAHPEGIQPIDKDVRSQDIGNLADQLGLELLFYDRVDIWRPSDYTHSVLGHPGFAADVRAASSKTGEPLSQRNSIPGRSIFPLAPLTAVYRRLRRLYRASLVRKRIRSIGD